MSMSMYMFIFVSFLRILFQSLHFACNRTTPFQLSTSNECVDPIFFFNFVHTVDSGMSPIYINK